LNEWRLNEFPSTNNNNNKNESKNGGASFWSGFNATVLDERVSLLASTIDECVALFGAIEVLFPSYGSRHVKR
jgi:hypothetical protein